MTIASLTSTPATPTPAPKGTATPAQGAAATSDVAPASQPQDPAAVVQAAVAAAMQDAAARQDGLAVLMANLIQASGKLPPALQKALDDLTALHLSSATPPDSTELQQAVRSSGLFTEAKLASGAPPADIANDVKTVLLRLNDAAQKWLARAAAETATLPAKDPSAVTQPTTEDANAARSTPARPTESDARAARATAQNAGAVARNTVQAAALTIPQGAPRAAAQPAPTADARPALNTPAAPRAASPTPATPTMPTAPSDIVPANLPKDVKVLLALLNKATDNWIPQPSTPAAQPSPSEATNQATGATNGAALRQPVAPSNGRTAIPPSPAGSPVNAEAAASSKAPATVQARSSVATALSATAGGASKAVSAPTTVAPNVPTAEPETTPSDPVALASAMQTIGRLTQAMLSPAADRAEVPADLKAVLFLLNRTASEWSTAAPQQPAAASPQPATPSQASQQPVVDPQPTAPKSSSAPVPTPDPAKLASTPQSAPAPSPLPNDLKTVLSLVSKLAEAWFNRDASANDPSAAPRPSVPNVPPPVAGAPGKAQAPAQATLPDQADPLAIASKLVSGSDAAVARQTLLQIASLPDGTQQQSRTPDGRWMMDIPVMTPQGSAVAQLIIERDGSNASSDAPLPVWRVQFAIDIEPLGPVRANLALSGGRTWVTISADRPDSLEKLRADASWLSDALQATDLTADIAFQSGRAPARKNGRSRLVDHAL